MKKGQVTVFMILGIILVLATALFVIFKSGLINNPGTVSEETEPVKKYVEECMMSTAQDAIDILGQQGGFIEIPLGVRNNPSRYLNPDGLGIIKMPLWYYKGTRLSPSRASAGREIDKYMEENMPACLDDFRAFTDLMDVSELGIMKFTTSVNNDDVTIKLEYPIEVRYRGNRSTSRIKEYSIKSDVRLGRMIDTANRLLDAELSDTFLENFTIDLMASHPDIPFTDMRFTCTQLTWSISTIKSEVEDMLFYNLPRIRIKNTDYLDFQEPERVYKKLLEYDRDDIAAGNYPEHVPTDAYEYLHMFWDAGLEESSFNIGFTLIPERGIDLIARPNDNGVLRSNFAEGNKEFIRFLCINVYHFLYDVNYPVMTTMRDDASFGGNGFVFQFAMPVTIHNNEAHKGFYGYELFTTTYFDRGFCEDVNPDPVDIRALGKEDGYVVEMDDVNLSLVCYKYVCPLGMTQGDDGLSRLRTYFPSSCLNPFIVAEKEGYMKTREQYDESSPFKIKLPKLNELELEVVYHRYNSIGDKIEGEEELVDGMNVSIQIVGDNFDQYKLVPGQDTIQLVERSDTYDVDLVLTLDGEYIGGYNGKWEVDASEVADAKKLKLHVLKYVPTPFNKEDKLKMVGYILNGDYKEELMPELE